MTLTTKLFFAGSGGQGILLMGQLITYAAMLEDKQVTFLPSYGPEMRGGTANCTVVVSDRQISSPLIYEADVVVAMNLPSLTKFESLVKPGGKLFYDTSLIDIKPTRDDIESYGLDADDIAVEVGNRRTANIVMLGEIVRRTGVVREESVEAMLHKVFSGKKAALFEVNHNAFGASATCHHS